METLPLKSFTRLLFVFVLTATCAFAQEQNAQVTGRVLDATGAAIPQASVTLLNKSRGYGKTVTSSAQGEFTIPLVPPGEQYVLSATKDGFASTTQSDITLQVAQTANFELTLKTGTTGMSVTVNANDITLDTQTSSIGQVIDGDMIKDLPLNGRSSYRLIQLTPGVTFSDSANGQFGDVPVDTRFDSNFSINGGRPNSNVHLLDGVPTNAGFMNQNTTTPIIEETQEFKVEASNLSAVYGRFSGGVINVSTKGGSNSYSGTLFEFARNSVFDANNWFNDANGKPKPMFTMNQFGGTFGGPVSIPHIYDGHDKTFFFLSYQGTRRSQGTTVILNVPTPAEIGGDFTQAGATGIPVNIFNPFTTTPDNRPQFTYNGVLNVIPPSMLDPVAVRLAQAYFPAPNVPGALGDTGNYTASNPSHVTQNIYGVRLDQNLTSRDHIFGHYEYSGSALQQPNQTNTIADANGSSGAEALHMQSVAINNVYTLSPSLLFSASYGFARYYHLQPTLAYGFDLSTLGAGWSGLASQASIPTIPNIVLGSHIDLGGADYIKEGDDTHSLLLQFTKVWGKHNLIFGYDGEMRRLNSFDIDNPTGGFTFNTTFTRKSDSATSGGSDIASFLLGTAASGSWIKATGETIHDFYNGLYIQDNVRLTPTLTLNLGVRYDYESPWVEKRDHLNFFDPNIASPAANSAFPSLKGGLVFANTNGVGRAVTQRDHRNFAPRFGFAWAPAQDIVFRGAYSLVYAPLEISNNKDGTVPDQGYSSVTGFNFGVIPTGTTSHVPASTLSNPFPGGIQPIVGKSQGALTGVGGDLTIWAHRSPTPYAEQYSLSLQFMLPQHVVVHLAYVGATGVHLSALFDHNTLPLAEEESLGVNYLNASVPNPFAAPGGGALSDSTINRRQLLLPYPQFGSVMEVNSSWGHSTYNAGQVSVQTRQKHSITFLTSFTWSKWMANMSATPAVIGSTNNTTVQDYYNLKAERSISDLDVPFHLLTNVRYSLPFGRNQRFLNRHGWEDKFVGGWGLAAIWLEQSGLPNALAMNASEPGDAIRPSWAPGGPSPVFPGNRSNSQRVGGKYCTVAPCGWFNKAAFIKPNEYTAGNVPRTITIVRKPGVQNLDLTLTKITAISKAMRLQLRVEAFNITNTPHFATPVNNISDGNFGDIIAVRASPPPRELQFAGKLFF